MCCCWSKVFIGMYLLRKLNLNFPLKDLSHGLDVGKMTHEYLLFKFQCFEENLFFKTKLDEANRLEKYKGNCIFKDLSEVYLNCERARGVKTVSRNENS